ncbi:MAG: TetR/AcrR family transcriptional regulator [Coriobacteriia bacterium]
MHAYNRLCEAHDFSHITVDDIAKEAGVSRSTFYHYFSDRNAVVNWYSLLLYKEGIDQIGRTLNWFEGHLITTKGFMEYRPLFNGASFALEFSAARPTFIRHRQETLSETVTEYKHVELTERLAFQIEAVANMEAVMPGRWEAGKYHFSLKELCDLLVSLVPRELFGLLNEPVSRNLSKGDFFKYER